VDCGPDALLGESSHLQEPAVERFEFFLEMRDDALHQPNLPVT
jgi:hypothetical protein